MIGSISVVNSIFLCSQLKKIECVFNVVFSAMAEMSFIYLLRNRGIRPTEANPVSSLDMKVW